MQAREQRRKLERDRKYRQEHREEARLRSARWRANLSLKNKKATARIQYDWKVKHPDTYKAYILRNRDRRRAIKAEVLTYYGDGKLACVKCGESRLACLSIDHIEGGGIKHRKELGICGGSEFYRWLKRQGFPKGYQTLCMNCQLVKKVENSEFYRFGQVMGLNSEVRLIR